MILLSSTYEHNGEKKNMAVTQFKPDDARRCFPCWDEPAYKVSQSLSLAVNLRSCDYIIFGSEVDLLDSVSNECKQKLIWPFFLGIEFCRLRSKSHWIYHHN